MHTLHHGFWMYFFCRKASKAWHYVLGAMAPDFIYGVGLLVLFFNGRIDNLRSLVGMSPPALMSIIETLPWVTAIDLAGHSAVVWAGALLATLWPALAPVRPFVLGWGTHILIDAATHAVYGSYLLYPLFPWQFRSPVSYWDQNYYGDLFRMVNGGLMVIAISYMVYTKFRRK